MRVINALLAKWNTMTTADKVKTVLHGIIMIGGGAIGNGIGDKFAAGRNKLESACVRVTGWALGSAVAEIAADSADEFVDQVNDLVSGRNKKEEGSANA